MKGRVVLLSAAALALLFLASCFYLGNMQPVASFTAQPTHGVTPLDVEFDASASHDPDGLIAAYLWDFGDGQTSPASVFPFTHQFTVQSASEVFTVVLTVTDSLGADDTAVQNITVDP